jgi:hypothetical protein
MKKILFLFLLFIPILIPNARAQGIDWAFSIISNWAVSSTEKKQSDPAKIDEVSEEFLLNAFKNEYGFLGGITASLVQRKESSVKIFQRMEGENVVYLEAKKRDYDGMINISIPNHPQHFYVKASRIFEIRTVRTDRYKYNNLTNDELKVVFSIPPEKNENRFVKLIREIPNDKSLGGDGTAQSQLLIYYPKGQLPDKIPVRIIQGGSFPMTAHNSKEAAEAAMKDLVNDNIWACPVGLPKDAVIVVQNGRLISSTEKLLADIHIIFDENSTYRTNTEVDFEVIPIQNLKPFLGVVPLPALNLPAFSSDMFDEGLISLTKYKYDFIASSIWADQVDQVGSGSLD